MYTRDKGSGQHRRWRREITPKQKVLFCFVKWSTVLLTDGSGMGSHTTNYTGVTLGMLLGALLTDGALLTEGVLLGALLTEGALLGALLTEGALLGEVDGDSVISGGRMTSSIV